MKIKCVGVVLFALISGCGSLIDNSVPIKAMESAGYTNVVVKDNHYIVPHLFGCDVNDGAAFPVEADNPNGKRIEAVVCCNHNYISFKACTIRY